MKHLKSKYFFSLIIVSIGYFPAISQIKKGDWMVGGYGYFQSTVFKNDGQQDQKNWSVSFAPDVQYFVINKLAVGLILGISHSQSVQPDVFSGEWKSSSTGVSYGPVVRYYFLPVEKKLNLFSEASAAFENNFFENNLGKSKYNSVNLTGSAGVSCFVRKNIAIEGGLIYQYSKSTGYTVRSNMFTARIGFQIHLTGKSSNN